MDDLFERTTNSPPSSLAAHLLPTPPPATGSTQQQPTWQTTGSGHVSSVQTSPTTWQDNITVTVQPQLLMSPQSPSHVLDIEVFQPQPQQQAGGDNNNTGDQAGDNDNGWSAILNSNPELKAVVSACEKYIPFLLIIMVKSVFEHGTGIIVCCGLVLTFLHANSVLKQQVNLYIIMLNYLIINNNNLRLQDKTEPTVELCWPYL